MFEQWVTIPGGKITLEPGGYLDAATTFELDPFAISKYPVTNAQFVPFIESNGYTNRAWWTDEGWKIKQKEDWQEPRYWRSGDWNKPNNPVVGVSWYEALAFCQWLSATIDQEITLPSEQQWQRAAQGDDGREYPWGNDKPGPELCNWNRYLDEITPVTEYPYGSSPYGVMDMSGNVWEWCLTGWETGLTIISDGREARLLRGGSWSSDSPLSLRAANRNPKDPNNRLSPNYRNHVTVGFRCVWL
jgi:formylglycine-generating enzyme required for sulfatase activity